MLILSLLSLITFTKKAFIRSQCIFRILGLIFGLLGFQHMNTHKIPQIKFRGKKIIKKKNCVLCFSEKLRKVLDFKKTPLANSYKKNLNIKELYFPLSCVLCKKCGHLQLSHLVNPKMIFENYLYVSGTSKILKKHFVDYAKKMISMFNL